MPVFRYHVLDAAGAPVHGEMEGRTRSEVYQKLLAQKLRPINIVQPDAAAATATEEAPERLPTLRAAQLLQFTEELADLLDAGLQLEPSLRVISEREERSAIKPVAAFLRQRVREGQSFSSSLRACGKSFSELYVNMVAAGEAAGALENILRRQAQHMAVIDDLQKKVKSALIYPAIVFTAGVVLLGIFMTVLLPQLTTLLSKTGKELPLATQMLIGVSKFMGHFWWLIILVVGVIFLAHKLWISSPAGRLSWDRIKLQLPIVGAILKKHFLAQFLQTLAILVSNGVVLLQALSLVRNATENTSIRVLLDKLAVEVGEGASLSSCLRKAGFFPAVLVDIIGTGEKTGKLGLAMQRGAKRYEKEFDSQVQRFTLLIQPAVILVVALFVGLIAYSMITGIFSTISGLRAH